MNITILKDKYGIHKEDIERHLSQFANLKEEYYLKELIFCLLTPQSNAKTCWQAVELLFEQDKWDLLSISGVLKSKTRFHNNKARYVLEARSNWEETKTHLGNKNIVNLRSHLADNVKGLGLKESSHFLRNIGKSSNQIAILDRHILRNLKEFGIIEEEKIKGNKHYLEIEQKFLEFSEKVKIPIDHLDLMFWYQEHNEFFK